METAQSWVNRTGQRTRAIATLSAACVLPAGSVLAYGFGQPAVALSLLVLAVLSFVAFATTIRCPLCHQSISWLVIISRPSPRWLSDLFALEECPSCDDGRTQP